MHVFIFSYRNLYHHENIKGVSLSNQVIIPCEVDIVGNCPNTTDSWNAAAQRKNCSNDLCGSNSVYHCLPTEKKQLLEVCADSINLVGKSQLHLSSLAL